MGRVTKAQTFRVGITGVLDSVDLYVYRFTPHSVAMGLEIRETDASGFPVEDNGPILASVTIPAASINTAFQWLHVDLASFGVPVTQGESLAVVLYAGDVPGVISAYRLGGTWGTNGYTAGAHFYRNPDYGVFAWQEMPGDDIAFRTYVQIPEPATLALLAMGGLFLTRRRRNRALVAESAPKPQHGR